MPVLHRTVSSFPSARIRSYSGGLPVEVSLIAQLGHGAGDHLIAATSSRQRGHDAFVDELDEPSARLAGVDIARGDTTSLYSFVVGPKGHPFHRHAGHRVFTAISGSAGAQLRFSTASTEQMERDPGSFLRALHYVQIPPDSLFTVRFGGGTWHQFVSACPRSEHPALFALSCHTDELGGELSNELRQRVMDNVADIPTLTEVLPPAVVALLSDPGFDASRVATTSLALDAPPASWLAGFCVFVRGNLGRLRGALGRAARAGGFFAENVNRRAVVACDAPLSGSLLLEQFADRFDHEDMFALTLDADEMPPASAKKALGLVLEGFVANRPRGVSRLMALRNVLVRPLGLRTSPLGCPASSLLSQASECWFDSRFPVLATRVDALDRSAQVVLGADDRHLSFRSCVGVQIRADGRMVVTLGTRVRVANLFGLFYMAVIDRVHRSYIAPGMLQFAVSHMLAAQAGDGASDFGREPRLMQPAV